MQESETGEQSIVSPPETDADPFMLTDMVR